MILYFKIYYKRQMFILLKISRDARNEKVQISPKKHYVSLLIIHPNLLAQNCK